MTTTLTEQALNRAVLGRQLYLERSNLDIPDALDQVAGIQNQYAPNGYIGLWSRLQDFERESLTRALESGEVVQGTSLRATIHLASPRLFGLSNAAVVEERFEWWKQATKTTEIAPVERAANLIRRELAKGPRKRNDLMKELGLDANTWAGATALVDVIRVPPSGTWTNRRADLYGLFQSQTFDNPVAEMVDIYLRAFGPAGAKDVSTFLGLRIGTIRPFLADRPTFLSPAGEVLFDIDDGLLPDPETQAPPRFLHPWEACLLVHARRSGILPEEYRPLIFNTKVPQSIPTFTIDGRVAGTWAIDANDLKITAYTTLDKSWKRDLDTEAEKLREFLA